MLSPNSLLHAWHARFSAITVSLRIGWALLALIAISLATMPLTQQLWTWDHFLRGGQDFETGSFLILISFCLLLVLARACHSCIARFLAALRRLARIEEHALRCSRAPFAPLPTLRHLPSGDGYTLPLQI